MAGNIAVQSGLPRPRDWLGLAPLLAGLLLLAGAAALTARPLLGPERPCQPPPTKESASGDTPESLVAVGDRRFRLGGGLCLGINLKQYFAAERATARTGTATRAQTVQIFFDNAATPATIALDIDGEGDRQTGEWAGWTWRRVALRPAATADSEIGQSWRALMTSARITPTRILKIGLADKPGDKDAIVPKNGAVTASAVMLEVFDPMLVAMGGAGLLLAAFGTVRLLWRSGLLRDGSMDQAGNPPPFSLGRVQMAFWLLMSVAGFLTIWLITGLVNGIITDGLLTLLGISASSGLAARLIDSTGPGRPSPVSQGFWQDIVSENYGDGHSVALHRVQMVAWTVILGMVFLWSVASSFSLPDFDTNLLLLIGISSGTYVGFKFPEQKNVAPPASGDGQP